MPKHHLAGIQLEAIFDRMIAEVGQSDRPLDCALEFVSNLPVNQQQDLICALIRELRALAKRTAAKEIAEQA